MDPDYVQSRTKARGGHWRDAIQASLQKVADVARAAMISKRNIRNEHSPQRVNGRVRTDPCNFCRIWIHGIKKHLLEGEGHKYFTVSVEHISNIDWAARMNFNIPNGGYVDQYKHSNCANDSSKDFKDCIPGRPVTLWFMRTGRWSW